MTAEDEAKFALICRVYQIGPGAAERLHEFISDVSSEAYLRGCDAQSYADSMAAQEDRQ